MRDQHEITAYRILVYDGSDEHWVTISNTPNADQAMAKAIKAVEDRYGTSSWRVWHCLPQFKQ